MEQRETRLSSFDAPIPGMSLTHEVGARPWQQPAQFVTVEEVVDHYTNRMMNNDEFAEQLVDVMDMGIPLTTIANTIQLAGVMEGKHSVDTGLLALPVIIETMQLIGDGAGVDYITGLDDNPRNERDTLSKRNVDKLLEEENIKPEVKEDMPIEEDKVTEVVEEEPMGLMQRRTS